MREKPLSDLSKTPQESNQIHSVFLKTPSGARRQWKSGGLVATLAPTIWNTVSVIEKLVLCGVLNPANATCCSSVSHFSRKPLCFEGLIQDAWRRPAFPACGWVCFFISWHNFEVQSIFTCQLFECTVEFWLLKRQVRVLRKYRNFVLLHSHWGRGSKEK